MKESYYHVLGLSSSATQEEIKEAYRKMAKQYHPDANLDDPQAEEKFKQINEAYQILTNESKKDLYDLSTYDEDTYQYFRKQQAFRKGFKSRYYQQKPQYSVKTKLQGAFVVILIVAMVFIGNYFLIKRSSLNLYNLGMGYYQQREYPLALASFDESIQWLGSRNTESAIMAAEILLYNLGQPSEALKYVRKGLRYRSNTTEYASLIYLQGRIKLELGQYEEAKNDLQQVIVYEPSFDSAYYYLGVLQNHRFKEFDDAIRNLSQALVLNDKFQESYLERGIVLQNIDRHDLAIKDFNEYLRLDKGNGNGHLHRAISYLAIGNKEAGCDDLIMARTQHVAEADSLLRLHCR